MIIDRFQGYWRITDVEVEGASFPPSGAAIEIQGNRFVSSGMGGEFEGTLEMGEATFDLRYDKGPHAGKMSLGIYSFDGTEWKMCLGMAGKKKRPEKLETAKGTGFALQTLRREAKPETARVVDEAATGEPSELEGEWRMVSLIQNGKPMPADYAKMARRVFAGDRTTLYIGPQVSAKSRVRVSAGEIDYLDLGQQGIYELSKGGLKISMAEKGAARPGDYAAVKGGKRTVTEWTRVDL